MNVLFEARLHRPLGDIETRIQVLHEYRPSHMLIDDRMSLINHGIDMNLIVIVKLLTE
jgi:hypothetical protein